MRGVGDVTACWQGRRPASVTSLGSGVGSSSVMETESRTRFTKRIAQPQKLRHPWNQSHGWWFCCALSLRAVSAAGCRVVMGYLFGTEEIMTDRYTDGHVIWQWEAADPVARAAAFRQIQIIRRSRGWRERVGTRSSPRVLSSPPEDPLRVWSEQTMPVERGGETR